eukprot:CAMPEP_0182469978 /NCGR_PEP_ID=MMETSP1319-20130603/17944_1 /TAXON_ID=172717 /ORGANISM="Bolidomonas pacifica, Strain RCC208" /LENGTH=239 /DNA_ID=CAMNT_0024670361 /DNA_START=60 /DNA_END=776 /DNA_ORIENTATION=+
MDDATMDPNTSISSVDLQIMDILHATDDFDSQQDNTIDLQSVQQPPVITQGTPVTPKVTPDLRKHKQEQCDAPPSPNTSTDEAISHILSATSFTPARPTATTTGPNPPTPPRGTKYTLGLGPLGLTVTRSSLGLINIDAVTRPPTSTFATIDPQGIRPGTVTAVVHGSLEHLDWGRVDEPEWAKVVRCLKERQDGLEIFVDHEGWQPEVEVLQPPPTSQETEDGNQVNQVRAVVDLTEG